MNVIDAAHKTVKDYPGGAEALATRMVVITQEGKEKPMSAAVLRSKVNHNVRTHHLGLSEASEIMSLTGDHRILHALAAEHGYVLRAAEAGCEPGSVLHSILAVNAAESEFDRLLHEVLADGVLTPNEFKDVSESGLKQQATLVVLLRMLAAAVKAGRA